MNYIKTYVFVVLVMFSITAGASDTKSYIGISASSGFVGFVEPLIENEVFESLGLNTQFRFLEDLYGSANMSYNTTGHIIANDTEQEAYEYVSIMLSMGYCFDISSGATLIPSAAIKHIDHLGSKNYTVVFAGIDYCVHLQAHPFIPISFNLTPNLRIGMVDGRTAYYNVGLQLDVIPLWYGFGMYISYEYSDIFEEFSYRLMFGIYL